VRNSFFKSAFLRGKLALPHHYNEADLQLAHIERNNAKLIDTIAEARKTGFISQGQIERARRFSGVVEDIEERAQDAAFEPAKWAKQPYNTHGYKAIEMAVFECIKLITAKHYQHLCMGIIIDFDDCGSQALVRLDTNLASRSDGNVRDIKTKYAHAVANFDEKDPVKWFDNILRQQQVLLHYRTGKKTVDVMEDAVHRIQACTGPSSEVSVKIVTGRITTADTKATGTNLMETDEVLSFEAILRA